METDREFYDALRVPLYEIDQDGALTWANPPALKVFNEPLSHLRGKKIWEFVCETGRDESERRAKAKLTGERPPDRGLLVTFRNKSTRLLPSFIYDELISDAYQRITGIRTYLIDLSVPSELLAELKSLGSAWFEQLENISDLFVLRKNNSGRITHANSNLVRELSDIVPTPIGLTDTDLFPPELAHKYKTDDINLHRGDPGGDDIFQDVEQFSTDRSLESARKIQVVKSTLRDRHTGVLGVQIVFWYLEKSEAVTRLLTETIAKGKASTFDFLRGSSIGFYRCYEGGTFQFVNQAFADILGYDNANDLAKLNMVNDIYFTPEEWTLHTKQLKASEYFHARQVQFKTSTGLPIWISVSARLLRDAPVVTFEGIIHSYAKEREQQKHAEQVARLQAAKLLAGHAAHELSNSLMECSALIESAKYRVDEVKRLSNELVTAIYELNKATQSLDSSSGLLGELTAIVSTKVEEIDSAAISTVVTEISSEICQKHALQPDSIICVGGNINFVGSGEILSCVLRHLIENAVYAAKAARRPPTITVTYSEENATLPDRSTNEEASPKDITIRIRDNGTGIELADLSKIWSRRFTRKAGHLGMGLYLTRMFVTSFLGGRVDLSNNEDSIGCTATIVLRR